MQLNAALPVSEAHLEVVALSRPFLPRAVGLTSSGVRRMRFAFSRSTAIVGVGCPSQGRPAHGVLRFAVWRACASAVLHPSRCLPRSARAACPSAVSARSRSAQAPRSAVRCSSAAALAARLGRSQVRSVALPRASCEVSHRFSSGAGKLAVMNATSFTSPSSANAFSNAASNPAFKRTSHGVPWSAA
jgi:hypothetical protein